MRRRRKFAVGASLAPGYGAMQAFPRPPRRFGRVLFRLAAGVAGVLAALFVLRALGAR